MGPGREMDKMKFSPKIKATSLCMKGFENNPILSVFVLPSHWGKGRGV